MNAPLCLCYIGWTLKVSDSYSEYCEIFFIAVCFNKNSRLIKRLAVNVFDFRNKHNGSLVFVYSGIVSVLLWYKHGNHAIVLVMDYLKKWGALLKWSPAFYSFHILYVFFSFFYFPYLKIISYLKRFGFITVIIELGNVSHIQILSICRIAFLT